MTSITKCHGIPVAVAQTDCFGSKGKPLCNNTFIETKMPTPWTSKNKKICYIPYPLYSDNWPLLIDPCSLTLQSNSEYLVRNPVQAALPSNKRQKAKISLIFFGWARPGVPRGPGTCSKFVQSHLMIEIMDGRVSDFDDIFILFMKIESFSR